MFWATGFVPAINDTRPKWAPKDAESVDDLAHVWLRKPLSSTVRSVQAGTTTVTVIGYCYASDTALKQAAQDISRDNWDTLRVLPGMFLSIVKTHRLVRVFGDLGGNIRVYYTVDNESNCWWSTQVMPLAALCGNTVCFEPLALELSVYGTVRYGGKTPFRDVVAVQPECALEFRPDSLSVHSWPTPSSTHTLEDASKHFRTAFMEAVTSRSDSSSVVAADISGGLDSSSVALLAAKSTRVIGVTYKDEWLHNDDAFYAQRVVASSKNIEQREVSGDNSTTHFSGLEDISRLPTTDLPTMDSVMLGYNAAKFSSIQDSSAILYLSGMAGDAVLHAPLTRLADCYIAGSKQQAVRDAFAEARRKTLSPWEMTKAMRKLAHTSYSQALRQLALEVTENKTDELTRMHAGQNLRWCKSSGGAALLTTTGAGAVAHELTMLAQRTAEYSKPGDFHNWLSIHETTASRAATNALASCYGMVPQSPFTDTAVLMAMQRTSSYERAGRDVFKPMLRLALHDVLPTFLMDRVTKGSFGGTIHQGIRLNEHSLLQIVDQSRLASAGLIDRSLASEYVHRLARGTYAPLSAVHMLIAIEIWLATIDLRKETWWISTPS